MRREPNTIYVASISYGKDSLAMLEAIKQLGYPLDRIISAQVWATKNIPADLPEVYEWKNRADIEIEKRYGIMPERVSATIGGQPFLIKTSSITIGKKAIAENGAKKIIYSRLFIRTAKGTVVGSAIIKGWNS